MQTWEFRRYVHSRIAHPKPLENLARVSLYAPCKGLEPGLKDNLRMLFQQDYPHYRLTLVVESEEDPACQSIRELMREHPNTLSQLVVAGPAIESGQKVHNLLVATANLHDAQILAFVDSDARPKRDWLRQLVQHLHHPRTAAATGYRWFVPLRNSLPNLILHSINASVAALVGPGKHHMIWGGAWAIRREVFEAVDLRSQWQGTLSDDLVAANALAETGMRIDFEPGCMTASPCNFSWPQVFEFVRRQYTVARFYSPLWWFLALVLCTITQTAFWGGIIATAIGIALQASWAGNALLISVSLYGTYVVRAALRQNAATRFLPELQPRLAVAKAFDIWLSPVAAFANFVGLVASLWGNCITWRSITYSIARSGQIRIVKRWHSPPLQSHVTSSICSLRKAG
jgi:hypothetical protein